MSGAVIHAREIDGQVFVEITELSKAVEAKDLAASAATELAEQLKTAKAQALDFARRLMEANAKLAAIHRITAPNADITQLAAGAQNELGQTMRELQQANPLQE